MKKTQRKKKFFKIDWESEFRSELRREVVLGRQGLNEVFEDLEWLFQWCQFNDTTFREGSLGIQFCYYTVDGWNGINIEFVNFFSFVEFDKEFMKMEGAKKYYPKEVIVTHQNDFIIVIDGKHNIIDEHDLKALSPIDVTPSGTL